MNAANAAACVRTASAAAKRHGFMSVDAALVDRRQQAVHPCGGCRRLLQQSEHWPPGLWRQQRQRGSSAVPPPATTAHRRMLDGCVDGHPSMDPSMVYNWLDSWRGGKGASLRPVSLGRSSVHPGACGNHGTWPVVASLGCSPSPSCWSSTFDADLRVRLKWHAHMHDRTLMHALRCMFTLTLTLSTGRSLTLTALMITLGPRRLGLGYLAAAVVVDDGGQERL